MGLVRRLLRWATEIPPQHLFEVGRNWSADVQVVRSHAWLLIDTRAVPGWWIGACDRARIEVICIGRPTPRGWEILRALEEGTWRPGR